MRSIPTIPALAAFTMMGLVYVYARRSGFALDLDVAFLLVGGFVLRVSARSLFLRLPRGFALCYLLIEGFATAGYVAFVDGTRSPNAIPSNAAHVSLAIVGVIFCLASLLDAVACASGADYGAPRKWE